MNIEEAATYLGIARKTLYKWKRKAKGNQGYLILSGTAVRFRFRQTGACGQGRIHFERQWLDALKSAMEDCPVVRRHDTRRNSLSHIHVPLGKPSQWQPYDP